ncbi:MAG TPA: LytTR family DNA-binding domain-containing protein [Steroidobacteraceae bacterium]|nr:LytTR family DNA-binding domain-containing protein [Steroidobacteraceae bacterium]
MRLKILVVDDEPLARDGLRMHLARQSQANDVIEAINGREAVSLIQREKPDLVLLDVQMPGMTGLEVVDAVGPDHMPAVIFATAHDQYAIRAFEISAVDYLLKPVTQERFDAAFERALKRLQAGPSRDSIERLATMLGAVAQPARSLSRFAVRSGDGTIFVSVDEVDRIEALQNYVQLHAGGATYTLHVTMNTIESSLDPERFLRIHRSHIVNVQRIKRLSSLAHGLYSIELASGERLQSGRTYGEKIRSVLSNPF